MNIAQFMSANKPAKKSGGEIDLLIKPFQEDISKLVSAGYDSDQITSFLKANGIHLTKGEILLSWGRIEDATTYSHQ